MTEEVIFEREAEPPLDILVEGSIRPGNLNARCFTADIGAKDVDAAELSTGKKSTGPKKSTGRRS